MSGTRLVRDVLNIIFSALCYITNHIPTKLHVQLERKPPYNWNKKSPSAI